MIQASLELQDEIEEIPGDELKIALQFVLGYSMRSLQEHAEQTRQKSAFVRVFTNNDDPEILIPEDIELELGQEYPELYAILRKVTDGSDDSDTPF